MTKPTTHAGVAGTYSKIHGRSFRHKMLKDIYNYVQTCRDCQLKRHSNRLKSGFMQPILIAGPFHTIGMDYLGPFATSKKRNRYSLVAVDHLSKWVETKPVRAATFANAAQFFIDQILHRVGAPARIFLTDRGTHFTTLFFRNILKLFNVEHVITAGYNPQCNGTTERMNRTLSYVMSLYVSQNMNDWDELVSFITWTINTTRTDITELSPF